MAHAETSGGPARARACRRRARRSAAARATARRSARRRGRAARPGSAPRRGQAMASRRAASSGSGLAAAGRGGSRRDPGASEYSNGARAARTVQRAFGGKIGRPLYSATGHEADLPAQEAQARTGARISCAHEHARGPADAEAASCKGPQAPDGLSVDAPQHGGAARRRTGRLSRSAEFDRVYRQGRSVANRYLVLYAFPRGAEEPRASRPLGRAQGRRRGRAQPPQAPAARGVRATGGRDPGRARHRRRGARGCPRARRERRRRRRRGGARRAAREGAGRGMSAVAREAGGGADPRSTRG